MSITFWKSVLLGVLLLRSAPVLSKIMPAQEVIPCLCASTAASRLGAALAHVEGAPSKIRAWTFSTSLGDGPLGRLSLIV
jgi:hypothetical protein